MTHLRPLGLLLAGLLAVGCAPKTAEPAAEMGAAPAAEPAPAAAPAGNLAGEISIDGSSTVFPVSQAMAEEFMKVNPGVNVMVGSSGTGGGFKKFIAGETQISDASRPIKAEEADGAKAANIEFVELPVAYDGLAVLVNPQNTWVDYLSVDELKKIWEPASKVKTWADVRQGWPAEEIKLFGPGTDSGTFDYFTDEIVGEEGASRPDYTPSEDDNVLVTGISGEKNALGYFGFAYYAENQDKLKLVPIKAGEGEPVTPSEETINNHTYTPLSRPIFIYVRKDALAQPQVQEFVKFYLSQAPSIVPQVGYVALPAEAYTVGQQLADNGTVGSVFNNKELKGTVVEKLQSHGAAAPAAAN